MLNTELAAGGELRLVSGEDVARAKSELPLTDEDTLAKSTLQRLRVDPGADVVVLGSYTPLPGKGSNRIRLDIRYRTPQRAKPFPRSRSPAVKRISLIWYRGPVRAFASASI
jgi:hypothetical protein